MHQENLDYKYNCKYHIREYVQAHDDPQHRNTNATQSLDCVYIRPMDNAHVGHVFLHIKTKKLAKQRNSTKIPITPIIIKQVNAPAILEDIPQGLKSNMEQKM